MPTARSGFALVNVNDTLFAVGGLELYGYVYANEEYVPIGYGTTPSPTLSATPSPSLLPSPTVPELGNAIFIISIMVMGTVGALIASLAPKKRNRK